MNYQKLATLARIAVLDLIHKAQTSHIASNLSVIDLLTVLFATAKVDETPGRDRIILSKGWAAASMYYFLSMVGILRWDEVYDKYCDGVSEYIGLVEPSVRGIECGSGAMGHGLPFGVGMALGAKLNGELWKTYAVMGDGEMDCGTTWESALLASHHNLSNLTVILDYNKFQAMGRTNEIVNLEPLAKKWQAFGWYVSEINGHNYRAIRLALTKKRPAKPHIIIAHTIKGRGVSFMEDKLEWHYKAPNDAEYQIALEELNGKY